MGEGVGEGAIGLLIWGSWSWVETAMGTERGLENWAVGRLEPKLRGAVSIGVSARFCKWGSNGWHGSGVWLWAG